MRAGGVPVAALLLVFASVVIQSSAEDIYWEGEEEASNEFLEVKEDDSSLITHLNRIKRDLWDFNLSSLWGSSSTQKPENLETATDVDDDSVDDKDDEAEADGSGSPVPVDNMEPREKTLRVSFVVVQPYQKKYSDRDSQEFQSFSKSLANAVNKLYEGNPKIRGTPRASLVRIQSRATDDFSCKVTLDIVTTGYDDMDVIENILRDHIRLRRALDALAVSDADFSAKVIDPARPSDLCASDEIRCEDEICVPISARCDGNRDCSNGADEEGCPVPPNFEDQYTATTEASYYEPEQREDVTDENPRGWIPDSECRDDQIKCDVTRCVEVSRRCDGTRDCDDGTDELHCGARTPANQNTVAAHDTMTHNNSSINSTSRPLAASEAGMTMELIVEMQLLREEMKVARTEMQESRNATIFGLTAAVNICNRLIDDLSARMDVVERQLHEMEESNISVSERMRTYNESDLTDRDQHKQDNPVAAAILRRASSQP